MISMAHKGCFLTLFFTLACDPAIVIHQHGPASLSVTNPAVAVRVKSRNLLIGVTQYHPVIEIENRSDVPITVANSELVAQAATFESKSFGPDSSNIEIAPGESKMIGLWFDLKDNVGTTFRGPAELRIHYRSRGGEQIVSVKIVGEPPSKANQQGEGL